MEVPVPSSLPAHRQQLPWDGAVPSPPGRRRWAATANPAGANCGDRGVWESPNLWELAQTERAVLPVPLVCCPRGMIGTSLCLQKGNMETHISLQIPEAPSSSVFCGCDTQSWLPRVEAGGSGAADWISSSVPISVLSLGLNPVTVIFSTWPHIPCQCILAGMSTQHSAGGLWKGTGLLFNFPSHIFPYDEREKGKKKRKGQPTISSQALKHTSASGSVLILWEKKNHCSFTAWE